MSNFPMPDYVAESAARLEKMSKQFGETLPKEMAAAINLMSHPATGLAAMTALGFGLAGQMLRPVGRRRCRRCRGLAKAVRAVGAGAGEQPAATARPSATVTSIATQSRC